MHSMLHRAAAALLCIALLATSAAHAEPVLSKVTVLHRHGARNGMGVVNGSLLCDGPYCQLTDNGKAMCKAVGAFLNTTMDYLGRLGIPNVYNVSFMHSEATEYPRVVVSAEAAVMGLFQGSPQAEALPFADFVPKTLDTKLVMWHSWPTWVIRGTYATELNKDDALVVSLIGQSNLTAIGAYFGLETFCQAAPTDCISFLQDSIACNVSAGLPVPAMFLANWDLYRSVVSRFLSRMFGYFPDDAYSAAIGSLGQIYVQDVLSFFETEADGQAGLMKLKHTAAHDWTLNAVYSTLGIWTLADVGNPRFVPRFAETLILELYTDSAQGGAQSIRALWGYPEQAPPTFALTNVAVAPMKCLLANGTLYNATGDYGCPLEDFIRFVNGSVAQAPDALCFASHDSMKAEGCLDDAAPAVGSRCLLYRMQCPNEDCGRTTGAIADPANGYACQSNQLNKGTSYYAATVIALVAPSLLAGAIFGFYGAEKLKKLLWPASAEPQLLKGSS